MAKIKTKILKKLDEFLGKIMPIFLIIVILNLSMPQFSLAQSVNAVAIPDVPKLPLEAGRVENFVSYVSLIPTLPHNTEVRKTNYKMKVWVSAYNSEAGQTDSTPFITANGLDLTERYEKNIEDIVAANFLTFGTKIRIPELFGDRVFKVNDRMNKRYTRRVDVWMVNKTDAIKFGLNWVTIEVF